MPVDLEVASYRMRLMAVIASAPSVREGCRRAGVHHSTYYDWLSRLEADGPDGLVPRRRGVAAKGWARIHLESQVVAVALSNPALGPNQLVGILSQSGVRVGSASQVWRILRAHQLNTRRLRYRMIAVARGLNTADHELTDRPSRSRPYAGRLDAELPGDLVQLDCFQLGPLKEARLGRTKTPGMVWQYTAIDVASSFTWAELHTTAHNPSAVHTTALAMRVAGDLTRSGWTWKQCSTDRGNEFVAHRFTDTLTELGVSHRFIPPGRPQSNGKVEGVQNIILQECWKPALAGYVEASITGLRTDLDDYLDYYNTRRAHWGRWNHGATPQSILTPNTGNQP